MEEHPIKNTLANNDIVALWCLFWKQKWLMVQITSVCLLIGIAYLFFSVPVYETSAYITSPMAGDIAALNYSRFQDKKFQLTQYSTKKVYALFINQLLSNSTQTLFFNSEYLPSLSEKTTDNKRQNLLFKKFSRALTIKEIPGYRPIKYLISFKGSNPEQLVEWTNKYIRLANKQALNILQADIKRQNVIIVNELENQIQETKDLAKKEKKDYLVRLKEAIIIADAAGIKDPFPASFNRTMINSSILSNPETLYIRGSKMLKAELAQLNKRESDEFFLNNLRLLESKIEFYKNYSIDKNKINLFRLDGTIAKPALPRSPMKRLVLGSFLLLGLILSTLVVLIRKALFLDNSK